MLRIMQERQECQDSQGAIGNHPRAEGGPLPHPNVDSVFSVCGVLLDVQIHYTGNQGGEISRDVGKGALRSGCRSGFSLNTSQHGGQV